MVEKFEVGKSYQCIDMEAYIKSHINNQRLLHEHFTPYGVIFVDGCRLFTSACGKYLHYIDDYGVLHTIVCGLERHLFEEVEVVEEVVESSNPTEEQVGGSHYTTMKLQPLQLTYLLSETPCFCKLAKYLTRAKDDKVQQTEKAKHVSMLEEALTVISLENYPEEVLALLPENHKVNYNAAPTALAEKLIDIFTDDSKIREALKAFNYGEFKTATKVVNEILEDLKEK